MDPEVAKHTISLSDFSIYATEQHIYVVATSAAQHDVDNSSNTTYRLIKFHRSVDELIVNEDPVNYTRLEIDDLLVTLKNGNPGSFRVVAEGCPAIIGCFQLTSCYYLLLVTRNRLVGTLCGTQIYGIDATALLPLSPPPPSGYRQQSLSTEEAHGRRLLSLVSLTRDFFYSPSWSLWTSIQTALTLSASSGISASGASTSTSSPEQQQQPQSSQDPFDNDRVWNTWLTQPLRTALLQNASSDSSKHCAWVTPLVHGAFVQKKVSLGGVPLTITLAARRSRRHAGTRFLRRGINSDGFVANECEIEQIIEVFPSSSSSSTTAGGDGVVQLKGISSVVQLRGSVPLFWAQDWTQGLPTDPGLGPLRPAPIRLLGFDPFYAATRKHFEDLRRRFGDPIICLDLLRKTDRKRQESALSAVFVNAIASINRNSKGGSGSQQKHKPPPPPQRLRYVSFDMRAAQRKIDNAAGSSDAATSTHDDNDVGGGGLLAQLHRVQEPLLASTGVFAASSLSNRHHRHRTTTTTSTTALSVAMNAINNVLMMHVDSLQCGVVRSNCVDCLDRTNVAQFSFGLLALGQQLHALGLLGGYNHRRRIAPESSLAAELMGSYESMGHALSEQYAGSDAHSGFFERARGEWLAARQSRNLLTSVRRFYSTSVTDQDKQAAIDLFLGNTRPLGSGTAGSVVVEVGSSVGAAGGGGGNVLRSSRRSADSQSPPVSPLPQRLELPPKHQLPIASSEIEHLTSLGNENENELPSPEQLQSASSSSSLASSIDEEVSGDFSLPNLLHSAASAATAAAIDSPIDGPTNAADGVGDGVQHSASLLSPTSTSTSASANRPLSAASAASTSTKNLLPTFRLRGFPWRWWSPASSSATSIAHRRPPAYPSPPTSPTAGAASGASSPRGSLESLDTLIPKLRVVDVLPPSKPTSSSPWLSPRRPPPPQQQQQAPPRRITKPRGEQPQQQQRRLVRSNSVDTLRTLTTAPSLGSAAAGGGGVGGSSGSGTVAGRHSSSSIVNPSSQPSLQSPFQTQNDFSRGRLVLLRPNGKPLVEEPGSPVLPDYGSYGHYSLEGLDLASHQPSASQSVQKQPGVAENDSTDSGLGLGATAKRLSFASLAALRSLVGGGGGGGGGGSSQVTKTTSVDGGGHQTSMMRSSMSYGALPQTGRVGSSMPRAASQHLDVVRERQALSHGLDFLGLPPTVAPLWRGSISTPSVGGNDVISAFEAATARAEEQQRRQREAAMTVMTPGEFAAAQGEVARATRPTLALVIGGN